MGAASKYYLNDDIPEIFRIADELIYGNEEDEDDKSDSDKIIKMPKRKKEKRKKTNKVKKPKKVYEEPEEEECELTEDEVISIMTKMLFDRDKLTDKLKTLNINNKKEYKKSLRILDIIKDIDENLRMLSEDFNIDLYTLKRKTRVPRFKSRVKRKFRRKIKKVKKFCKRNIEAIAAIASIAIPFLGRVLLKKFLNI